MANEKYFIVAIGGTGMRCIEAFTHMCAIGMFDNKEFDILTIDTDTNNGNKGRSEQLIDQYIRIKGGNNGKTTANSFFTAKLNIYKFAPEYSDDRITFELISGLNTGTSNEQKENKALSDLFFDDDVQQFNLDHGYRAQTHLGSHLMYHCIVEAARNITNGVEIREEDRTLLAFIDKIQQASENARVFILGSIFGGTGASSIPIIPKAFRDAIKIRSNNLDIHKRARFGCSLLTEYFKFTSPEGPQQQTERIIADAKLFSLNSQAALMFYQADYTVKTTYNTMYHIGWPKKKDFSENQSLTRTITGGEEQKNPCHITELLSACAMHDFFNRTENLGQLEIVFRSANFKDEKFFFEFKDFFGAANTKEFMNKIGAFLAFSHIVINREKGGLGECGTANLIDVLDKEFNIHDYKHINSKDSEDIDLFLKSFSFDYDTKGNVIKGWLFQVKESTENPLLFNSDAFSLNQKQLKDFDFGKLFVDKKHHFHYTYKEVLDNCYDKFRNTMQKDLDVRPNTERQKAESINERFIAHIYNTLTKLYNIINN